jgi:hypothetical protein
MKLLYIDCNDITKHVVLQDVMYNAVNDKKKNTHTHTHTHTHTKARQELMPPIVILCYLLVRHEEISRNLTTTLLRAKLFFFKYNLHLCQCYSSTFRQKHTFLPNRSFPPPSAEPHYLCNGVLTGCFSKNQMGGNVMM